MASDLEIERRMVLLGLAAAGVSQAAWAQSSPQTADEINRGAPLPHREAPKTETMSAPANGDLSVSDADSGVREALSLAAINASLRLGRSGGYWEDAKVRLPLPAPLADLQARLAPLKLSMPLDSFQKRLNTAAEMAAPRGAAIFLDAIKSLTLNDALGIVRGGQTAGTQMLKAHATQQLTIMLTLPIADAFAASGADEGFERIRARYKGEIARLGGFSGLSGFSEVLPPPPPQATEVNAAEPAPTSTEVGIVAEAVEAPVIERNPDPLKNKMIGYAVAKALDGLFVYLAEEEVAIRRDPAKRTTDLLRRVFGAV